MNRAKNGAVFSPEGEDSGIWVSYCKQNYLKMYTSESVCSACIVPMPLALGYFGEPCEDSGDGAPPRLPHSAIRLPFLHGTLRGDLLFLCMKGRAFLISPPLSTQVCLPVWTTGQSQEKHGFLACLSQPGQGRAHRAGGVRLWSFSNQPWCHWQ